LVPVIVFGSLDPFVEAYIIGGVVLFAIGIWDDAQGAGHYQKFAGQILAVVIVIWHGDVWISNMPYFGEVSPEVGKPFTLFAIVGAINAINHSDGLDGLAGGEGLLSLIVITVLAAMAGSNGPLIPLTCAIMGALLGFLLFNSHPARVFMGDAGSQFLGFTLGVLAVYLTQVVDTRLSPALTLLFLGFPIADILTVLGLRVYGKMHWFEASRNHVHHRLLDCGFGHFGAVCVIWSVHTVLVVSALVLRDQNDLWVTAWYLLVCGAFFGLLVGVERERWSIRHIRLRDRP
jgi:UDP-GlcNAc:undecaprenyl-phosphate GlcNAc-1-phosphate transferase